jgi:hypothetical protein
VSWEAWVERLAANELVRHVADTLFLSQARRRISELDHSNMARCQARILRGLVHRAQGTRFGRDHDFGRIRTPADFRRLVPLRTPSDFWQQYWQGPERNNATWPGGVTDIAGAENELPVPLSADLLECHHRALMAALEFGVNARPRGRLFSGRLVFLGDGASTPGLPSHKGPVKNLTEERADNVEALVLRRLRPSLRPYFMHLYEPEDVSGTLTIPVTCIAGPADRLARFFCRLQHATGRARVNEVWHRLVAVLYTREPQGPGKVELGDAAGEGVLLVEVRYHAQGAVAVEDPRHGALRLLADHGVYFEFVPLEELRKRQPTRHGLAEVEPGVPYAVAVSSPAGVWACFTGDRIAFVEREPPLLRVLESPPAQTTRPGRAHPFAVQPPHPRAEHAFDGASAGGLFTKSDL